ncbi:MAG: peptidase [Methanopyri archaeon]|nr:peptidase [Methanopyri archaeon]
MAVMDENLLDSLLEAAAANHPNEFLAFLGGRIEDDTIVIDELVLVPFEASEDSAITDLMALYTRDIQGTFHSHPSGDPTPSDDDLLMFKRLGAVHAIAVPPYTRADVRFYDTAGRDITPLVGVEPVADDEANNHRGEPP